MNISEEFSYRRKYYVRDLLNPKTLVTNTATIEFDSFDEFVKVVLKDEKIDIQTPAKLIIPVRSSDEVSSMLSLNPEVRSFLILKLESFTKSVRDSFSVVPNVALMIDSKDIDSLKEEMVNNPSDNFVRFLKTTYGYFTDTITSNDVDDIMYKYTDPFYKFPFFCISAIKWDWYSFQDYKMKDLRKLIYQCRFISNNLGGQSRVLNYSKYMTKYGLDSVGGSLEREYLYDRMKSDSCKCIYVKDGKLYIDSPDSEYFIDMYDESLFDGNNVDLKEVNRLRLPFDIKISMNYATDINIVSINQNIKCTGNPAIIPYQCLIVGRILNGGAL